MAHNVLSSTWPPGSSEMARLIREHDWSTTPLGPVEGWPESLRAVVSLMLASPLLSSLAIGPERVLLYNDAAARLYGDRHPNALGRPPPEIWPESYLTVAPFYDRAFAGETITLPGLPLDVSPSGGEVFEAYLTPVYDAEGEVLAVHMTGFEVGARLRAEQALRESEERYRQLFEHMDQGFCLIERVEEIPDAPSDYRYLVANPAFERHTGLCDPAGRTIRELVPDPETSIMDIYDEVVRTKAPRRFEAYVKGLDLWMEAEAVPADGPGRIAVLFSNVSDRKRVEVELRESEARQAFLLELSDALRPLSDPIEVQNRAADLVGQHLGADRSYYYEVDPEGWATSWYGYSSSSVSLPQRFSLPDFGPYAFETYSSGRNVVVGDMTTDPRISEDERKVWRANGLAGGIGVPLHKNGRLIAILGVNNNQPREWSPADVRLLEEVAERTWAAVEQSRAETALRESEERLRAIVETAQDYAIFTTDADGKIVTWPAGAQKVFGWSAEEAVGQPLDITFTPEDRAASQPEKERREARETGRAPDVRWHMRKDGSRVFIEGVTRPLVGVDHALPGFLKVGQDVTERRATEAALRESESRFRQFGNASGDVLWIRDCETLAFEYVSPAMEGIYGTKLATILEGNHVRRWAEMIVPEDRDRVLDNIRQVREGEHVLQTFQIQRDDGQIRWIRDTSFPLLDEDGHVQRVGGIGHDATEEVELQDRLRVLVAELQHRSRNLVGVVKGVTDRTLATSETLEDFRPRFRSRLEALARVNSLLSRLEEGDRITFDQLVQTELQAHGAIGFDGQGEQVSLSGPKGIRLRSATVQTFALAIHELATNALKYGALSRPEGRLEVRWSLLPVRPSVTGKAGERWLRVEWREDGVPPAHPDGASAPLVDGMPVSRRQGYGRELIERALPYQLKAQTSFELTPEGVRCTITVPVSSTLDVAFSSQGDADA